MRTAAERAHALGKKLYVAVNIFARNPDFGALSDYFSFLRESGADAAIVSDPGVIYAAKKSAPGLPLHLSTQANTTNKYAVKFWSEQGISRVILARELSLPEIAEIKDFQMPFALVFSKSCTSSNDLLKFSHRTNFFVYDD